MHLRTAAIWLLTLLYPLVIYFGLGHVEPRWLALFLLLIAGVRALASRDRLWIAAAAGAGLLVVVSMLGNVALPLKLYPVLVNVVLLVVFAVSLRHPPSLIERLARLREPELPPHAVAYTRQVTKVWCGFFIGNGGIALATAMVASNATWALYNGLIAYVLMGLLFAGEWLVRQRVKAAHAHD